jgi:hypothetical protein
VPVKAMMSEDKNDDNKREIQEKSELEIILEKSAYTDEGISQAEYLRALELIAKPVFAEEKCRLCKLYQSKEPAPAIYDTELCQRHAIDTLNSKE